MGLEAVTVTGIYKDAGGRLLKGQALHFKPISVFGDDGTIVPTSDVKVVTDRATAAFSVDLFTSDAANAYVRYQVVFHNGAKKKFDLTDDQASISLEDLINAFDPQMSPSASTQWLDHEERIVTLEGAASSGVPDGDKGDITVSGGGTVWTIDDEAITSAKLDSGIDAAKIANGSVSNTEFQYLNGVTSNIQDQINNIGAGAGTVDTANSPNAGEFAKFTDADTLEGRTVAETKTDLALNNVPNVDTSTTANITDSLNKRFITDAQQTVLGNTSGTNTGDQTISTVAGLQTALDAKAPLASPALTGTPTAPTAAANTNTTQIATTAYVQTELADLIGAAPGALDTLSEIADALNDDANFAATITTALASKADDSDVVHNTGNETVAGIKTFSSFPVTPSSAPVSDYQTANKKYVDDAITGAGGYNDEAAQDAVGAMVDSTLTYVDATPLLKVADGGIGTTQLANDGVTNTKAANMAQATIKGRQSGAGTGDPEDLTAAQARTILNVADGATANSSDATLLNRANHTGTQTASTISDFNAAALAAAPAQNIFSTIAVAGQSNVVADTTSDTLTLIAGSNVTITTNATNDEVTIAASGGGGGTPGGSDTQLQFNNSSAFGGISGATTDGTNVTFGSTNLRATRPRITTSIDDSGGNEAIKITATASAVNEVTVANAATGSGPVISATGDDADIDINITPKGSGKVNIGGSGTGLMVFPEGTPSGAAAGKSVLSADSTAHRLQVSNNNGAFSNLLVAADIGTTVQAPLVSGTSLKTVNGSSLLGSGDLVVGGGVDTANSPNANEFARFTDADTIEGRTVAETRGDLGLATTDSPQFAALNIGDAGDTTLARASAGNLTVEGNALYRAGGTDVPVADGGTGASTAAGAATNLGLGTGDSPQFTAVNIGHATDTTLSRSAAGVIAVEGVTVPLNSTTNVHTAQQIELGHASDTTLARVSAGVAAIEGNNIVTANNLGTDVLTQLGNAANGSNASAVGFRGIPQNSQSANYTLVMADAGKHILHPSSDANARTFTIPANSSVAFPIGTTVTFVNETSQNVTIAINTDTLTRAGTTTTGSFTLGQNGVATAVKVTATKWIIDGSSGT